MASSKKPPCGELPGRLDSFLKQAAAPGQIIVLGLSGGLDSCVLLHLLATARASHRLTLRAVHINHGLSPNAGEWERFCADLCGALQVPFSSVRVTVPRDSGLGIEAAAREARYRVFLSQPADAIVLAHHRDDQAETLLLQLLRGAGVKGLAAMPEINRQSLVVSRQSGAVTPSPLAGEGWGEGEDVREEGMVILRPLLDVARSTLEAYAQFHGLRWIEDESNLDLAYDRNFLRHHIFPELEKRFPASRTTLARSAAHFAEAASLLDEIAAADAACLLRQGQLAVDGLRALSAARAKNLLRYWLAGYLAAPPSARRLQEVHRQLLDARPDAQLCIALEGGQVRRYRGEAFFEKTPTPIQKMPLVWNGEKERRLPGGKLIFERANGKGLALVHASGALQILFRSGGERFRLDSRRPTRSLRHLFQEAGVPPWERSTLPLIYAGDELAVVPGIGVACGFQAGEGEEGLVIGWERA